MKALSACLSLGKYLLYLGLGLRNLNYTHEAICYAADGGGLFPWGWTDSEPWHKNGRAHQRRPPRQPSPSKYTFSGGREHGGRGWNERLSLWIANNIFSSRDASIVNAMCAFPYNTHIPRHQGASSFQAIFN